MAQPLALGPLALQLDRVDARVSAVPTRTEPDVRRKECPPPGKGEASRWGWQRR